MAKKAGRPKLPESEKRKPAFVMKLSDAEHELIKKAAGEGKLATWARDVLLRAARRQNYKI